MSWSILGEYDEEWDDEPDLGDEEEKNELATIVIFDCELTPTQLSNLQDATGVEVLDRTGVILEIFSRHAKSRGLKTIPKSILNWSHTHLYPPIADWIEIASPEFSEPLAITR